MKFAKVLQETLNQENIPEDWIEAAIQYKALKKIINSVVEELKLIGLEQNTLKLLLQDSEVNSNEAFPTNAIVARYALSKTGDHEITPRLKITIDSRFTEEQGISEDYVNSSLIELKNKIEHLMIEKAHNNTVISPQTTLETTIDNDVKRSEITVKLNSDAKFFNMLETEIEDLDHLTSLQEDRLVANMQQISEHLAQLTNKSTKSKDFYQWRELFKMYLDSEIYFKYNESSSSSFENSTVSIKQRLDQFTTAANKLQFKGKTSSHDVYNFVSLNYTLLKVIQFQSINATALKKILKKFDKQTNFHVKNQFPKLISHHTVGQSVAQKMCSLMHTSMIKVIPQIDDFTCPICFSVAYKPIRLECNHLFCVRCLVKMKMENRLDCPICRHVNAVTKADSFNLDRETMLTMKKYFPREIKQKIKERDRERYEDFVGDSKCVVM